MELRYEKRICEAGKDGSVQRVVAINPRTEEERLFLIVIHPIYTRLFEITKYSGTVPIADYDVIGINPSDEPFIKGITGENAKAVEARGKSLDEIIAAWEFFITQTF